MKLENKGQTELVFYFAAQKDDAPGVIKVTAPAGETVTAAVKDLGAPANRFLNVYNPNAAIKRRMDGKICVSKK